MNVFVAGMHHETNTFAPSPADWAAFEAGAGYPAYARGAAMLEQMAGTSLSIGGFAHVAREQGWRLVPSAWGGAMPSNRVTEAAFERLAGEIVEDLRRGGFDAVYLDLHGAGVADHVDDIEGELLERVRAVVGPAMPVVASLDLHANVTERMLRHATAMSAFRTYPHVDMRETGARAARMLATRTSRPGPRATHAERVPFLLPLNAQCTMLEPAASIIALLEDLEREHGVELSFAMGFAAADFAECGPVLFGYGEDADALRRAVRRLYDEVVVHRRGDWAAQFLAPDAAVEQAIAIAQGVAGQPQDDLAPTGGGPGAARSWGRSQTADKPVVIADTQDNPGAGGDSNTTGMLHALIRARAGQRLGGKVAIGLIYDPAAAAAACAAGIGARLKLRIGKAVPTWTGELTDPPVDAELTVLATSDGVLPLHGPMTAGATMKFGPSACVELDGIRVLLVSAKAQLLDQDMYRFLGVEPTAFALLVNKSSVHFRAAFAPIASHILVAKAPGPMAADPADLPWRRLPEAMARRP